MDSTLAKSPSQTEKPSEDRNIDTRNGSATLNAPPRTGTPLLSTTELVIAAAYPATLILASIFYHLSPSPATSESYFSKKSNIFNTAFVKYGWVWTTIAFLAHLSRLRAPQRLKAMPRYLVATVWWIVVTQWALGPPLMDRVFLWTGGACEILERQDRDVSAGKSFMTSAACKVAGGRWNGGHDLSGHVFLLTHASLFLWAELLPILRSGQYKGTENTIVYAILGLWWWMLLMTGIYFHTASEKFTGLVVAIAEWGILYAVLPRILPRSRDFFG